MHLLREGFHEKLFLLTDEQDRLIVRKQAKSAQQGTLAAEIVWLEELPATMRQYFPRVLHANRGDGDTHAPSYDMPYFDKEWVPLSELILLETCSRTVGQKLIAQVMRVMFSGIFPTTYPMEAASYPEQMIRLLERCAQQITAMPVFAPLMRTGKLSLNGVKQWNVFPLLEFLKSKGEAREALRPAAMRKVHGDLYPENVLVYLPSLRWRTPRVMLIDPVAAIGLTRGDFAMDVAKFRSWLSAELLALRLGFFSIETQWDNGPAFELSLHTDEPQLSALSDGKVLQEFSGLLATAPWARAVCDADPNWWARVSFYESLYALSMVPLVPAWQSMGRFLVGVHHLNNFVATLNVSPSSTGHQEAEHLRTVQSSNY
ncbi:MAG: hypothetical protein HOP18_05400 [Deltaproteobacteria bacterium]|nr:hypothetical protein [Deltaproteobacteria bacterium]